MEPLDPMALCATLTSGLAVPKAAEAVGKRGRPVSVFLGVEGYGMLKRCFLLFLFFHVILFGFPVKSRYFEFSLFFKVLSF